jgi:hypothetical protein
MNNIIPDVRRLLEQALTLTGRGFGARQASWLRLQLAASLAPLGRVVVVGEAGVGKTELITAWLGEPSLGKSLEPLGAVPTIFYFSNAPRVNIHCLTKTVQVPWPDLPQLHAAISDDQIQLVTVAMESKVLKNCAVVEEPPLHVPGYPDRHALDLTPATALVMVVDGVVPVSDAEAHFLCDALKIVERAVAAPVTGPVDARQLAVVDAVVAGRGIPIPNRSVVDRLYLARNAAQATARAAQQCLSSPSGPPETDVVRDAAEKRLASASQASGSWLPRLAYEVSRVRADYNETVNIEVRRVETAFEQLINQSDIDDLLRVPGLLASDLEGMHRSSREALARRVEGAAMRLLGRIPSELTELSVADRRLSSFVPVAATHVDVRTEAFATLGNFSTGRQSIGILTSIAAGLVAPITVAAAAIGLGFVHFGRRARQAAVARADCARWMRAQVAECARLLRHAGDTYLNESQLVLNLAARAHFDRAVADARTEVSRAAIAHDEACTARKREIEEWRNLAEDAMRLVSEIDEALAALSVSRDIQISGRSVRT